MLLKNVVGDNATANFIMRCYVFQKEEERLRASMRRESKQKRIRERGAGRGLSTSYLEPDNREEDGSEDEGAISLAAIKSKYKKGGASGKSEIKLFTNLCYCLDLKKISDKLYSLIVLQFNNIL